MPGQLKFHYGLMNSGKSSYLLMDANGLEEEKKASVLLMKPKKDTKDGPNISGRLGLSRKADIWLDEDKVPSVEIEKRRKLAAVTLRAVYVDEAQFLPPWQVDDLLNYANENPTGADVIAYGLRTDFNGNLFPGSKRLFEVAEVIEPIHKSCGCGEKVADFNARLINGEFVFAGDQVAIDGEHETTYKSVCISCYQQEVRRAFQEGKPIDESPLSISGISRVIEISAITTTDKNEV